MTKQTFTYLSADQKTPIHAVIWAPETQPAAILQIAHGMVEFIDRYDAFAAYLTAQGFLVAGNDHLGHGASVTGEEHWGYFAEVGGADCVLEDMRQLTLLAKTRCPGVPFFLLGHSMGSFFTRKYLCLYGKELNGAIICGTGWQPAAALATGSFLTRLLAVFRGWHYRSKFIDKLAFGGMNKPFEPAATPKDWLTRDARVVQAYLQDARNGFIFTLNACHGLFSTIAYVQNPRHLAHMPKALPVLFIAGQADPVGNMGKGVEKVAATFTQAGMQQVKTILYPEYRHEILNELGKEVVYKDVAEWIRSVIASQDG
ncbi:MAG: alpha/beta hydrolase [Ruminococcaceae bacterium]|nr:alpha/beta hydrolase [Oscillospiraceae bacterium]